MKKSGKRTLTISHSVRNRYRLTFHVAGVVLAIALFFAALSLLGNTTAGVKAAAPRKSEFKASVPLARSQDQLWQFTDSAVFAGQLQEQAAPRQYATVALNQNALTSLLARAPMEFTEAGKERQVVMTLPLPDGQFARFRIEESPVVAPELAATMPDVKTYRGQGIDDPAATARFDWTPLGFHAIILSGPGATFIAPIAESDTSNYIAYFNQDVSVDTLSFTCEVTDRDVAERGVGDTRALLFTTGSSLRTYRLAVAATGEFTQQYGGGDVNTTLTRITTMVNLVNAIYQKEATITFQLIANETSIIFTDPVTDGYTNGTPSTMLGENQTKLDTVIGSANYDIGHVFGGITVQPGFVSFSGVASVGVVCTTGTEGRGVSTMGGGVASFPHSIFVTGVTHEIAHQFSARHTFNSTTNGCNGNRTGTSAWEPGSGSTLMAYSICGNDNLQPQSDQYFHTNSLEQILGYAASSGACATTTSTGNSAPVISGLSNRTIPANTPFVLDASATDPNSDPMTFIWEESDLGAAAPPHTDDGTRPLFRSFIPSATTARLFPRLQYILNNANTPPQNYTCGSNTCLTGELLPSTTRTMTYKFTARDNRAAGGGTANASLTVSIVSTAGPFLVTAPNTAISWTGGTAQTVTWSVNNTNAAPVSCANVKISLSTDGGNTFPTVLAASTANDGSETITAPNINTTTARVKVEAVGNIFFDISNANFTITAGGGGNGSTTIGVYRSTSSTFFLRNSNSVGPADVAVPYGGTGDLPIVGDWDGDGDVTIGVYRPTNQTFYLRNSNSIGVADIVIPYGAPGDTPIVGDWDGNGTWTIGVYRASNQTFYLRNSNSIGFADISIPYGAPADTPIVGDWDGNGTMTIGVYRSSSSTFFLRNSNSVGPADVAVPYGGTGDLPLTGDWNGDSTTTIGVYRPTNVTFYLRNSNSIGIADISVPYGATGDTPIVGDWDGL